VPVDMQELLTYEDVSRITQFKICTLRKWVQLRKIPFVKLNGSIRFNADDIRAWAAGGQGTRKRGRGTERGARGADGVERGAGELFAGADGGEG
jgi:excisionase family DNA binding protein